MLLTACSEDERIEKFQFQLAPQSPPIIFANRTLTFVIGEEVQQVEILGPWMNTGFAAVNDNDRTITIVSAEFNVTSTGADGKAQVFFGINNFDNDVFGVFKAEGDINCNGLVEPEDATSPEPQSCPLDEANPSFTGDRYYIFDLLNGVDSERIDEFRGTAFNFEVRLEGWFGGPDDPQESFFKIVYFTVSSNG